MKIRYTLPVLALVLGTGAFYSLQAQDSKSQRAQKKFEFKLDGGSVSPEALRRMAGGDPDVEKQLSKAYEEWQKAGAKGPFHFSYESEDGPPAKRLAPMDDEDTPPNVRPPLRFQFPGQGMGRRMGKGSGQGDEANDPAAEMRRSLEELFGLPRGGGEPRRGGADAQQMQEFMDRMRQLQQGQMPGGAEGMDLQQRLQKMAKGLNGNTAAESSRYSKHHRSALAEWRPLVKEARESTLRVIEEDAQIALATIVTADGYAISKNSELKKDDVECEFHDGRIVKGKVVDRQEAYDLALIKLEATGLTPARILNSDPVPGTLIAAVSTGEDPTAVGVISVPARSLSERSKGALGIKFDIEENAPGVRVENVMENSAASKGGLKDGDVILTVNGEKVDFTAQVQKLITSLKPGDMVKLTYTRDGKELAAEFPLGSRQDMLAASGIPAGERPLDVTARMGTALSQNANGYPSALQCDLTVDAADCGAPVVDVEGNVVGISIARSERVSTYLIPARVISMLLTNVRSGEFTLAKDESTLKGEIHDADKALRDAETALKDAQSRREKAESALKKLGGQ